MPDPNPDDLEADEASIPSRNLNTDEDDDLLADDEDAVRVRADDDEDDEDDEPGVPDNEARAADEEDIQPV